MEKLLKILNEYIDYLNAQNYSKNTLHTIYYDIKIFICWLDKKNITEFNQVNYSVLFEYQEYLTSHKSRLSKKTFAVGTQKRKLIYLKSFFKYLVQSGVLMKNPAVNIILPCPPETFRWTLLTIREIKKLLLSFDLNDPLEYRNRTILELFYSSGVRASELCNLKLNDIDYKNNFIKIEQGKGANDRVDPVCSRVLELVRYYVENIRKLFNPVIENVFVTCTGKNKLKPIYLEVMTAKAAENCGLKKRITPQCLRIASATHMLKNGADIRYVQQFLGHKVIDSTMRYLKLDKTELKKVHTLTHPRGKKEGVKK